MGLLRHATGLFIVDPGPIVGIQVYRTWTPQL